MPTAVSTERRPLNCLEARELNYIIAVRCYSNIKRSIYGLKDWVEICDGIEVCEFIHQSEQKAAKPRRHFVVRKSIEQRPEVGGKLLFEDLHEGTSENLANDWPPDKLQSLQRLLYCYSILMKYRNPKKDSDLFSMIDHEREITQTVRGLSLIHI